MKKTMIESSNQDWGFFGTMRTNYDLRVSEVAVLFDFTARLMAKHLDTTHALAKTDLDDRWGRHFADFQSFHGGDVGLSIEQWKKILRKTVKRINGGQI